MKSVFTPKTTRLRDLYHNTEHCKLYVLFFVKEKKITYIYFRGNFLNFQKTERVLQNFYMLLELIEQEGNGFPNTLIANSWLVLV